MLQKRRNALYLEHLRQLIEYGEYEGIKIVFLKGFFLGAELYKNIEDRKSKDIDCLINIEDFPKLHTFIQSLGYRCEDASDEEVQNGAYREKLSETHICYSKCIGKIKLTIEVHCSMVNAGNIFRDYSTVFLKHTKQVELLGLKPYVLEIEYNIIFLMLHFFKHLPYSYLHRSILGLPTEINLSNLNDLALLIDKYNDHIQWDIVLQLAKKMYVVKYILITSRLINRIYGQLTNNDFLIALSQSKQYTRINEVQYENYGLGKFMWLFDVMLESLVRHDIRAVLEGELIDTFECCRVAVENNNKLPLLGQKTTFEKGFDISWEELNISSHAKLGTEIDHHGLQISLTVSNKCCCAYEGEDELFNKDGIEVLIIKKKQIVHMMFTITYEQNQYGLIETSQNDESNSKKVINNTDVMYELEISPNGFLLEINIPFSYIQVNPLEDTELIFDVGGLISNPITKKFTNNYKLFKDEGSFFEFRGIGGIRF